MNSSLNHIYRVVWNASLGLWQVASEVARHGGKAQSEQRKTRHIRNVGAAVLIGAFVGCAAPGVVFAQLPTGGQVVGGQASLAQHDNVLTITQGSDRAAIDWQSFNVGQGNTVNFNQPSASSIALNRVLGNDVSVIQGAINANGQVFLVNQSGVLFTPSAQVNVGGLVASTQNINADDFMAGRYTFSGSSNSTVENQGNITAANGGHVALIAAKIINTGRITTPGGSVGLAAGHTVIVDLGGPVKVQVTEGALNAVITQGGGIVAEGGQIFLTAKAAGNLAASVINHTGVSRALSMAQLTGQSGLDSESDSQITLNADLIAQAGTLDVSGVQGGTSGGHIELTANLIIDSGTTLADGAVSGGSIRQQSQEILQSNDATLSASGATGVGGVVELLGGHAEGGQVYLSGHVSITGQQMGGEIDATANSLTLAGATIDSSGTDKSALAGKQRIGGGWQGKAGDLPNAVRTLVNASSMLKNTGEAGVVVVWSDAHTTYAAALNAPGSAVEISGKEILSAFLGNVQAQSLLLDPKNIEIKDAIDFLNVQSIVNPNNNVGDNFGGSLVELSNGNFVVAASSSDITGSAPVLDVGRVYLFASDGSLVSTLSGSATSDQVGSGGITALSNGNYVINSGNWDNGTVINAGAVTWGNGVTGVNGVVGAGNSLVGSAASDAVGLQGITALNNGNYVVRSSNWDNGTVSNAGAVTWGNGTTGISGEVSASNSLVGDTASDQVGSGGVTALSNGNYVVRSTSWDGSTATDVGAVTWGNGATGISGVVSASNSLVGSKGKDGVGNSGITVLSNGNYVVRSSAWDNGTAVSAGAVTWGDGTVGVTGEVSALNSLVGTKSVDDVGSGGITALSNGNYVVNSRSWDNGTLLNVGAVTWGNGTTGVSGEISASDSLVGSTASDLVGFGGVTALSNGNYVVVSRSWDNGTVTDAGAVTWGNGTTGTYGVVSASNSLVGSTASDNLGSGGVTALSNGNYVVVSNSWNNGSVVDAGAVTWGNGTSGTHGVVSASNSLVGSTALDNVGSGGITALINGNYIVTSINWDNDTATNAGAVSWGDGTTGVSGVVGSSNSLVGSTTSDFVGQQGITVLSNGNYVVTSNNWGNGTVGNVGAVTWGNGTNGVSGIVSASNSLVGSTGFDQVGSGGVTALINGNYVVNSRTWDSGIIANAGAVTWGNGTTGVSGVVSASNSLVGSTASDLVGLHGVTALGNGNYVVNSNNWDNGTVIDAGAVTWGNGSTGISGEVSTSNSLTGGTASDLVGSGGVLALGNGDYVVTSSNWDNGVLSNAGALSFVDGDTGHIAGSSTAGGVINSVNSMIGNRQNAGVIFANNNVVLLSNSRVALRDLGDASGGSVYISDGTVSLNPSTPVANAMFSANPGADNTITPEAITALLNAGTSVTLQANNDITVSKAVTANNTEGDGGMFTLEAGRHININALIETDNGDFTAVAGSTSALAEHRDAGNPTITLGEGAGINAGSGTIQLVSVGINGQFVNNAGSSPFTAAQTLIYLPSFNTAGTEPVTFATLNDLAIEGKRYNTTYSANAGGPQSDTANLTGLTGVNLLYALAPTLTVTPTTGQTGVYGDTHAPLGSTLSGFVDGDDSDAAGISGQALYSLSGTLNANDHRNVGEYDVAYASGLASSLGYQFVDANLQTNEFTISAKALTVAGIEVANKTYDGTTAATVSGGVLSGLVEGERLTVNNTGTFDSKNSGDRIVNTTTTLSDGDALASNYSLSNASNEVDATIHQKVLTISGTTVGNKTYDGTTDATVTVGTLIGLVEGESLGNTSAMGTFEDKNAAEGKNVFVSYALSNGENVTHKAGNYLLNIETKLADIARKDIVLSGFDAAGKVYDGTVTATINAAGSLVGVVQGDAVNLENTGATFDTKNAGVAKTVTLNGVSLAGTDAGNYNIASTATDTADVSKLGGVIITADSQSKRVGEADPSLTFSVTGLLIGDGLQGALSRQDGEAAGLYAINQGNLDNSNYIIQFNGADLSVTQPQANLPDEAIANANTVATPELQPSIGERSKPDLANSDTQQTFFVTPEQARTAGPTQVLVVEGGINLSGRDNEEQ